MIFGTKLGFQDGPFDIMPMRLGEIYREVACEFGDEYINKPIPGDEYRKMYHPIDTEMDGPAFRDKIQFPETIIVVSPPRLYRSNAWKYHGQFQSDAEVHWEFQFKYPWNHEWAYGWMGVRFLSTCYFGKGKLIFETIRNSDNQLRLF